MKNDDPKLPPLEDKFKDLDNLTNNEYDKIQNQINRKYTTQKHIFKDNIIIKDKKSDEVLYILEKVWNEETPLEFNYMNQDYFVDDDNEAANITTTGIFKCLDDDNIDFNDVIISIEREIITKYR